MKKFWSLAALFIPGTVLGAQLALPGAGTGPVASPGWVRVEGKDFQDGLLVADKIEARRGEHVCEIEGAITQLDTPQRIVIGRFTVLVNADTRIEKQREPSALSQLSVGARVKARIECSDERFPLVRRLRVLEGARDGDFEIMGPLQVPEDRTKPAKILFLPFQTDQETRFVGLAASLEQHMGQLGHASGIRRDDDEPVVEERRWGRLRYGGKVTLNYTRRSSVDPETAEQQIEDRISPRLQSEFSVPISETLEAYAKLNLRRRQLLEQDPQRSSATEFEVREAFLFWKRFLHRRLSLQLGRQRFRDQREWLYDTSLDAVRLHFRRPSLRLELAAARGLFGEASSPEAQMYLIGRGSYRLSKSLSVAGYLVKRNDLTRRDEDPVWIGVSGRGRLASSLDYWAEASLMRGRRQQRRLRGFAYDVGLSYRFDSAWRPTISAGYASGSGDDRLSDGVDGNFRQTQLHDNTDRFFGLKRLRYYGVLTDPELSNLKVGTIAFGVRPSQSWSFDLVWHNYRQVVLKDDEVPFGIDLLATGIDPDLGQELDFIFTVRRRGGFEFNLLAGVYFPGDGVVPNQHIQFFFGPTIQFYF